MERWGRWAARYRGRLLGLSLLLLASISFFESRSSEPWLLEQHLDKIRNISKGNLLWRSDVSIKMFQSLMKTS